MTKGSSKKTSPDSAFRLSVTTVGEQGMLESFFKLPQTERGIIRRLLEKSGPQQVGVVRLPVAFAPNQFKKRRNFLLPVYKLIQVDSVSSSDVRQHRRWCPSFDLPPLDRINHAHQGWGTGGTRARLNSDYEKVWRMSKQRLNEPGVRLESQYSSRLYQLAKQYVAVGYKRVSLATLRKILGLEEIKDNSGRVVQEAPLELWAKVKQRALDQALKEINKHSDIQLELEFTGRGAYRKVLSLGFRTTARKQAKG